MIAMYMRKRAAGDCGVSFREKWQSGESTYYVRPAGNCDTFGEACVLKLAPIVSATIPAETTL